MKKFLILYALAATALLGLSRRHYRDETLRLRQNQYALSDSLDRYRTLRNEDAASIRVLHLRCSELKRLRADDARRLKELGIRIRRAESMATTALRTKADIRTPIRDTVILRDTVRDTIRLFRWQDRWVTIACEARSDSVHCRIESIDTLRQTVHREPRRFLFIRYGTKALRQEIVSSNPHTRIVYAEYIEIGRKRR